MSVLFQSSHITHGQINDPKKGLCARIRSKQEKMSPTLGMGDSRGFTLVSANKFF